MKMYDFRLKISLKSVLRVKIKTIPALVQTMTGRRPGDQSLSEPCCLDYWRIYTSLGLNELTDRKQINLATMVNVDSWMYRSMKKR